MTDDERPSLRLSNLEQALGGKYKIIERIGLGGFGEVYLGEHTQLHRKVAIKLLSSTLAGQKEVVERFQREAKAAATMSHPNIIDIYDVGQSGEMYYFVMKYIDGETLSERMHRLGKIDPAEAIHIIRQVADALAYAHMSGIIHRDIKPANVMLDEYGKPVLMDFGVARVQFEGNLTKTGTLMGTPHYLPPELPLGKKVDGRSDIYSLGIMLYEMIGGKPPFHDENSVALIFKHINEMPQPLKELTPTLDDSLVEAVHKMIEKLPEKRYQSADEVVDVLHKMTQVYPAPPPSSLRRSTPGINRNTEKLLILAQEHMQQEKYDKAIELYATLTRRDPNNESARREIAELITRLIEKLRQQISEKAFAQARELLAQAQQIGPNDERLNQVRDELKRAEEDFWNQKESEFRVHYDAAQTALQSDNAMTAIEHLTKASTIHATSPELQDLLKKTQDRITGEINMLCEKLDFTGAEEMLNMSRQTFPDLGRSKSAIVERHRALYQKMVAGREHFKQQNFGEATRVYQEFLKAPPTFEFEVFKTLRTEAEDALKEIRAKTGGAAGAPEHDPNRPTANLGTKTPVPGEDAATLLSAGPLAAAPSVATQPKAAAPPVVQAPAKKKTTLYAIIAALVLIGGAVIFWVTRPAPAPEPQQADASQELLRKLSEQRAKPGAPVPTTGTIAITSTPPGAKVFLGEEQKGVTPLSIPDLPFGKYMLKFQLKGYQEFQQEVEVTAEKSIVELPATLVVQEPTVGILTVESTPPGAFIVMGTRVLGVTPRTMEKINAGKYNITLKMDGFHDYTTSIRIKDKETTTVSAKLEAIPKAVVVEKPKEEEVKPGSLVALGADVIAPKAIKKTNAKFPNEAKSKRLSGTVKLSVLVSETGKVIDIKIVQSAHPLLDGAAIESVKEWIYEPAKKKGVPVKVWVPVSMSFVQR